MSVHKRHQDVLNRLARIEGHVHGVKRMVEEDKECPDILLQLTAIRSAVNRVSQIILEDHIENCISKAIKEGTSEEAISTLREALSRFIT